MELVSPDTVKLGFIGLGNMGGRIAERLLNHGYRLTAYDRVRAKSEAITPHGGTVASDIANLARNADVILSCVTNDEAVQNIYYGDEGVLRNAKPGAVVLEMSTVLPKTSSELHRRGGERQIEVLDVAISGSTPAAERGTLVLLVGGDAKVFQAVQLLFAAISARSFYMGPAGAGTTMKLVVNTLLGVGMQAIAEAIPLGEKAGIQRHRLLDVLSKTAVIAPAHVGKLTRAAQNDYSPQFPLRLMNKDFRLILEKAKLLNVPMPATAAAFNINSMEETENPEEDFSAVIRRMEELAHVSASE